MCLARLEIFSGEYPELAGKLRQRTCLLKSRVLNLLLSQALKLFLLIKKVQPPKVGPSLSAGYCEVKCTCGIKRKRECFSNGVKKSRERSEHATRVDTLRSDSDLEFWMSASNDRKGEALITSSRRTRC